MEFDELGTDADNLLNEAERLLNERAKIPGNLLRRLTEMKAKIVEANYPAIYIRRYDRAIEDTVERQNKSG